MFEIGTILKEARLHRRIDLVVAEQDTKIRSKYLAALETEDFDVLPGPVFVRGFLRTYTRYLGLDPQTFIDEYNARFGRFEDLEEHPALGRPGLAHERGRRRMSVMRLVVIVSLVALSVIVWLGLRSEDAAKSTTETPRPVEAGAVDSVPAPADAHEVPAVVGPKAPVVPTKARLAVQAVGGTAWIEVRNGSATGPIVFSGEVADGASKLLTGKRLYVTAGAPAVTVLRLRGRSTRGTGAGPAHWIVTPTRVVAAP